MVFSSFVFLWLFLPLTVLGAAVTRGRARNGFLLAASLAFYAWGEPKFIVLLLASVTLNWAGGLLIARGRYQNRIAAAVILADLLLLGYFKYFNFFAETLNAAAGHVWIHTRAIALPIGISFYTFQAISYIVDLVRGTVTAQRSWFRLALYIAFFPQLVAGPIIKYGDIEAQLSDHAMTAEGMAAGFTRFCRGLGKKVLIANTLGRVTDSLLGYGIDALSSPLLWTAALFYTLQIYFDFSGYSDMAIGLARVFGFRFAENFNYPYRARSVTEFWRRWHISLSSWFRDYLYIPLGGSRRGTGRTLLNLFIVFFATGLWHGAQWNFVVWGLYHGCFRILEKCGGERLSRRLPDWLRQAMTLLIALCGWVFFRADNLTMAFEWLKGMFTPRGGGVLSFAEAVSPVEWLVCGAALLLSFGLRPWLAERIHSKKARDSLSAVISLLLFFASLVMLANAAHNPFIYFRF